MNSKIKIPPMVVGRVMRTSTIPVIPTTVNMIQNFPPITTFIKYQLGNICYARQKTILVTVSRTKI